MTNRVPRITRTLLLYRVVQLVCFPIILIYFVGRLLASRAYWSHFGERLGFLPQSFTRTPPGSIWLHAVSVGEVASSLPLIRTLREDRPKVAIYLSTSTVAGRRAANHQAHQLVDGIFYVPFDLETVVRRAVRTIRPGLVIVLETEIWPNLYHEVKRSAAGLVIVNGRISNRTWPRYLGARGFFGPVLSLADRVFVQSKVDHDRYAQLGVALNKLTREGNLKYDAATPALPLALPDFGADRIWIAASTVGPNERGSVRKHSVDEDDVMIAAFRELARDFPGLLLILAPRQPRRFDTVAEKLRQAGLRFVRRSDQKNGSGNELHLPGVLLLDSIGELSRVYSMADVAFVGGSIAPRGGHNILEPAAAGVPIVVGKHMQNFEAIVRDFIDSGAIVQIQGRTELAGAVRTLLTDRDAAARLSERAQTLVHQQQGVCRRIAPRLWEIYCECFPQRPRTPLASAVLRLISKAWIWGGIRKRARGEVYAGKAEQLPAAVVSIGGITVGGSGKTPFAKYLAERFRQRGWTPAILTRGYRRKSTAEHLVFAPGVLAPTAYTGDEARIFLRAADAAVGIGSDRYTTAKLLLSNFPNTDVLVLDDGFQHARMRRDLDIVMIDGLDPWGGGAVVPRGRLREPLESLSRASVFVVTRAEEDCRYSAVVKGLKRYAPEVPVFRSRLIVKGWRDAFTGAAVKPGSGIKVAAFCGLGNPQNFWSTIAGLGPEVVLRWPFPDHHRYRIGELQRLVSLAQGCGITWLVTTEKDCNNLPENAVSLMKDVRLLWLEIDMEVENEAVFLREVESRLRPRGATLTR